MTPELFPHMIGHPLGQDIHEIEPEYKTEFKPGMVITIEPGIYLPHEIKNISKQFSGMGIRIEDNILITNEGQDVITKDTPKEIEEIEKIMSTKNDFHFYIQNNFQF
jgi:Xaa-Pro aminopeptidase